MAVEAVKLRIYSVSPGFLPVGSSRFGDGVLGSRKLWRKPFPASRNFCRLSGLLQKRPLPGFLKAKAFRPSESLPARQSPERSGRKQEALQMRVFPANPPRPEAESFCDRPVCQILHLAAAFPLKLLSLPFPSGSAGSSAGFRADM